MDRSARRHRLDDAACSRDLEEVVAARLQTCSANVCMTHVRTAARSLAHRDQLSNASAAHFVREDEDPCKMTYSRMALIERDLSATTQMQMHSQMGFSCSNRRAARQRQASGAAHTRHGGARLARACVTETPQAESRATGGARLLAQTTAAQLRMLITTTRWTGPTCCWKTVAMAGEWTAAGTATGRAVLMVPVGAVAMRRRAGGCSWRSRGSREPRDGLGGDSQHLLRFGHSTSYPPSFWSQHSFVLVTTYFILLHYKTRLGQPSSGRWEEGKEGAHP